MKRDVGVIPSWYWLIRYVPPPARAARRSLFPLLACLLAASCAGPQPLPTLPAERSIDVLLGEREPSPPVPPGLPGGPDQNIKAGQCKNLPAGMWVSPKWFAERIAAVAARDRCVSEVEAYRTLGRAQREALVDFEKAYRERVGEADRRAELRLWFGILAGAGAVLVGAWAAGQVGK